MAASPYFTGTPSGPVQVQAAMTPGTRAEEGACAYRDIQGFDFDDEAWAAACSRWNRPPLGGVGLAASAAFFSRSAFWIGVSEGSSGVSGMGLALR
jgi:hypothetical protein